MLPTIFVYNGIGISHCYVPYVSKIIATHANIKYIQNLDFLKKKTYKNTDILLIGGGRGKYVLDNFTEKSISILQKTISEKNIRYIGICCGAYLACSQVIFDDVTKDTLGLCSAISVGPYYKKNDSYYNYSLDNSTVITSRILKTNKKVYIYLNGGGWFTNIPADFDIISCYENSSLANTIVNTQMFLSHPHIEHPFSNEYFQKIILAFIHRKNF